LVNDVLDVFDLLDWRRGVFALYDEVRAAPDARAGWETWRATRDELFRSHPQSPIPEDRRSEFEGVDYYDYDPAWRVLGDIKPVDPQGYDVPTSGDETFSFDRVGVARFELNREPVQLELYWLKSYGGGLFLPFRDATSGKETYGAGRYLLDTVKGADLGSEQGRLVLDFNFAYNPSCSYDAKWVCPLAPPPNRLDVAVTAGERHVEEEKR
jgi:uncharacterized protein